MIYVYLLCSVNFPHKSYVGITNDLKRRFAVYNSGGSVHTARYKPWEIIVYIGFNEEDKARKFEKYLKSHSGRVFMKKHFW